MFPRRITLLRALLVACAFFAGAGLLSAQDWKLGVVMTPNAGGGVRVVQVFYASPAQQLGMKGGDVILTIDGQLVSDPWAVRAYVMDPMRSSINLVYFDGWQYKQAEADFVVVAAYTTGPGGPQTVTKKVMKNVRIRVVPRPVP